MTVSLFLTDLVGPVIFKDYNHFQVQALEELRGMNLVNFDEYYFIESISMLKDTRITKRANEAV